MKRRLIGKDHDAGKHRRQEEKGATVDEMVGWYHQLSGLKSEQTLGESEEHEAWYAAVHGVRKSWTQLSN